MIKIITAMNNPNLNEELKKEDNIKIVGRDIQYKEGILEFLENNIEINYIIIDEKIPGEIEINKLIDKIFEKNKKIKVIITIKKENKNQFNFNNKKVIKIYYEKNINLNKLKNYNILNNKKENKKLKIINFIGEKQVGKSITILNISNFLNNHNYKILIIEKKSENSFFNIIFKSKIKSHQNKKICNFKIKKYKLKSLNKKILNTTLIIKANKNIDLYFYEKIINYNLIEKIKINYDFIFIENNLDKNIINNFQNNILIIRPNLLGIKNAKEIIKNNKLNNNDFKILINNSNKNSIDKEIIKNIFYKNKIIGKIDYQIEYEKILNDNFKNIKKFSKEYKNNIKKIIDKIIN